MSIGVKVNKGVVGVFGALAVLAFLVSSCTKPVVLKTFEPVALTGNPVKVLVVMMEFVDIADDCPDPAACEWYFGPQNQALMLPPRLSAKETLAILEKNVNDYYQKATFGKIYFDFDLLESPRENGWWASAHTLTDYNKEDPSVKQEGVNYAYTVLGEAIYGYKRLLVIYDIQGRDGQAIAVHKPSPFYAYPVNWEKENLENPGGELPGSIPLIVANVAADVSEEAMKTVASHELGHMIGAVDNYYSTYPGMGPWDLMDRDQFYFHFCAWTKLDRGWLDWNANTTSMPCVTGACEITTALDPVEKMGNNALLIPIVNFSASNPFELVIPDQEPFQNYKPNTFVGIMAECRKRLNGDEKIPQEGVLVSFSNPELNLALAGTASEFLTNDASGYNLLQPGDVYVNDKYHVTVQNISQPGDKNCTVKAQRNIDPAPDLSIIQSSSQSGYPFDRYRSIDIWNDVMSNGQWIYPASQEMIEIKTLGAQHDVPKGNGDPLSIEEPNLIFFMVHNIGTATAKNVQVNIYARKLIHVSVQGSDCGAANTLPGIEYLAIPELVGTNTILELKPGETIRQGTHFNLSEEVPVEIEVEVVPPDNEVNTFNNIAYETFSSYTYNISDIPGYAGPGVEVSKNCVKDMPFIAREEPLITGPACENWDVKIEPSSGKIQPGEVVNFNVTGVPLEGASDRCQKRMCVMMPITSSFSPVACLEFNARVVEPASLTCNVTAETVAAGEPVSVTGALSPQVQTLIGLRYTPPEGESVLQNTETGADGVYSDSFIPSTTGVWNVKAIWSGDEKHSETVSPLCRFTVTEPESQEPVFNAGQASACREGTSTLWRILAQTEVGTGYPILGVNPDLSWYFIQFSERMKCWIDGATGTASGDLSALPVYQPRLIPPTLVPTITPTSAPRGCSRYTTARTCEADFECRWLIDGSKCVKK